MTSAPRLPRPERLPLHLFLHRRMKQLPHLTNVAVAEALEYPRPNVIAMIFNGSMKLPIDKVPAMARVLEIDPAALMRRTLTEYEPALLEVVESTLGLAGTLSEHERSLIDFVRNHLAGEDVDLIGNTEFCDGLGKHLVQRHEAHIRELLAERRRDAAVPRGAAASLREQAAALFRKHAAERAAFNRLLG